MKKTISMFAFASLIVVGGYAVQVNHAQAVTPSELVELFVVLDIIPADQAETARQVVNPPFIEGVSTSVTTITDQNGKGKLASYTMRFDITANGNDVYIKDTYPSTAVRYHIETPDGTTVANASTTVVLGSTANMNNGVYVVHDGETKTFIVGGVFDPTYSGFYRFKFDSIAYGLSSTTTNDYELVARPDEDFQTDLVYLDGELSGTASTTSTQPAPTQPQTLSDYVEYFISMGIIPPENAGMARAAIADAITFGLNIALAPINPDASTIKVSDEGVTKDVAVLIFDLSAAATGTDAKITSLPIRFDIGQANFNKVVNNVTLDIDGVRYGTSTIANADTAHASTTFTFGPSGLTIPAGTTKQVKVMVDFNKRTGNYEDSETVKASIGTSERDAIVPTEGYAIEAASGTAIGAAHALWSKGIFAEVISTTANKTTDGNGDDTGTYTIMFDVTAFERDFYISATNTAAMLFHIEDEHGATVSNIGPIQTAFNSSSAVKEGDAYKLIDGQTDTFKLSFTLNPTTSGTYRLALDAIEFGTISTSPFGIVYKTIPEDDFTTNTLSLNHQPTSSQPTPQSNSGGSSSRGGGGGGRSSSSRVPVVTAPTTPTSTSSVAIGTPAISAGQVLGVETFKFNTDLRSGMQHNDVAELQKRLRAEGFFNFPTATGYFGPATHAAVQAYQKAHGIDPTGFVGPMTRTNLNNSSANAPATAGGEEISLEALVKLLITLNIIPTDKAAVALAAVANMAQ